VELRLGRTPAVTPHHTPPELGGVCGVPTDVTWVCGYKYFTAVEYLTLGGALDLLGKGLNALPSLGVGDSLWVGWS